VLEGETVMRNINLLPRKPFIEKNIIQILAAVVLVGMILGVVQISISSYWDSQKSSDKQEMRKLTEEIEVMRINKVPDGRTTEYQHVMEEVMKLKLGQKEWLTDVTYIVGWLPKDTILIQMGIDGEGLFSSEMHFSSLPDMLLYIQKLQAEPGYESLKITGLTRVVTVEDSEVSDSTSSAAPARPAAEEVEVVEETQPSSPDDLNSRLKELLGDNEVSSGMNEDELSYWLGEDSPFTKEQLLEILSETEVSDSPLTTQQSPDTASEAEGVAPTEYEKQTEEPKLDYVRLTLEIQLLPLSGKESE
jgi:hypothetical protein